MVTLILSCWFSSGCAGGDRFCRRSLRPAAGKLYQKAPDRSIRSALSAPTLMLNVASSAYDPRRKRCWTGIELRAIGRISIVGDDLPGCLLKLLPVCRLTITVAHDKDAPLRREVRLARLIAADHRRRNVGVAA